jgi:hypothetical protein
MGGGAAAPAFGSQGSFALQPDARRNRCTASNLDAWSSGATDRPE